MTDNCFKQNELLIPGTRRDNRLQSALDPSYVSADERSLADILVFISNYATLVNYYSIKGESQDEYILDGDWKPLLMHDEAFNYAGIAVTPYTFASTTFYKYISAYENGNTQLKRKAAYRVLWDIIFSLYRDIHIFYSTLPETMPLRNEIIIEIKNGLSADFHILAAAYLNDAIAIPGLNLQLVSSASDDDYQFGFANKIINGGFDTIWIDEKIQPAPASWLGFLNLLHTETALAKSFFNTDGFTKLFDRIDYSTLQLKQVFKRAFEAYSRIIIKASAFLQVNLQNNSGHYAHNGLILSFIQLFDVLRIDMNGFTKKHLEYYYSRVLKIQPLPAVPDSVHVVFEPAKNINVHLIEKDTALNAGKDALGKLMLYNTSEEIVINQASIQQLKTTFVKPAGSNGTIDKIYASSLANSSDGKGAPFTTNDVSWKGFADVHIDEITGAETNLATIGFFIASPILLLTEGNRIIELEFKVNNPSEILKLISLNSDQLSGFFDIYFSGEKQWEKLITGGVATDDNGSIEFTPPVAGGNTFKITLKLNASFKPVVGYNPGISDDVLNTIYPVVKFVLNQASPLAYETWRDISLSQIHITTTVCEITDLCLQNDLGVLDVTKPIQLFGPAPKLNTAFYIGHTELQYKIIKSFEITLLWLDYNNDLLTYYTYKANKSDLTYVNISNNNDFKAAIDFTRNKSWITLSNGYSIFEDGETTIISLSCPAILDALNKPENFVVEKLLFTPQTQNGFLKLTLNSPTFGHETWPAIFAQQTAAVVNNPTDNEVPNPPYTPLLKKVSLKYVAEQDIDFSNNEKGQFFYLMPFGTKEVKENVYLLPVFQFEKILPGEIIETRQTESSFIIGIDHATINQNISILFQVSEGTEDISVNAPSLSWNYLSVNGWKALGDFLLADSTLHLIKPGIIQFRVPADINTNSTELPKGLAWISASVEPDLTLLPSKFSSQGLPKMLAVIANAVKTTFVNNGNDPGHLASPLAANKISKLYNSDALVKKVTQPFPSFDGKKIESGNIFYTRVSERLKHKNRAITIWDYEHLVLNEFPQVYMLKCLNHTGYVVDCSKPNYDPSAKIYRENVPGKVMLITIPYVTNIQSGNKFQPALSAAVLQRITDFVKGSNTINCNENIKPLNCRCIEFKVENPQYETISISCKIKVKECLDVFYYKNKLFGDLDNFLSPWLSGDVSKINFGGRLHVSQVIFFIEQLPYIDYVTNVTLQQQSNNNVINLSDDTVAVATTSKSILTSSGSHNIQLINA